MSRLRKIYKGEEDWDILFTDGDKPYQDNLPNNKADNTISSNHNINNKKFNEDFKNSNNNYVNKNSLKYENTKIIENKLNNVSLNKDSHKNLYDIDNDNLITEEEVKEFKFENFDSEANSNSKSQNPNNISNNNIVKANNIVTEDDYDLFYQMEIIGESQANMSNNIAKNAIKVVEKMDEEFNENGVDENDKGMDYLGKRTHSEAFGKNKSNEDLKDENCQELPLKIRKTMDV